MAGHYPRQRSLLRAFAIVLAVSVAIYAILAAITDAPTQRFAQLALGASMLLNAATLYWERRRRQWL